LEKTVTASLSGRADSPFINRALSQSQTALKKEVGDESLLKLLVMLAALGFNLAVAESAFGVRFESTIASPVITEASPPSASVQGWHALHDPVGLTNSCCRAGRNWVLSPNWNGLRARA
jgi:hypothetical protein